MESISYHFSPLIRFYSNIEIPIATALLREKNGKEDGVFTGHQPRQAALKAANRSKGTKSKPVELRLTPIFADRLTAIIKCI